MEARKPGLDGAQCAMEAIPDDGGYVGVAAMKVSQILPLELFAQSSELARVNGQPYPIIEHYRRQWLTFAGTLANLTMPLDILYVIRSPGLSTDTERLISILFAVLAWERHRSPWRSNCHRQ